MPKEKDATSRFCPISLLKVEGKIFSDNTSMLSGNKFNQLRRK